MNKEPKKMWRCANDFMGYCKREPDWVEQPWDERREHGITIPDCGGRCAQDLKTCGQYQTYSQMLEERLKKGAKVAE